MTFLYGGIYEGEGRRNADDGDLNTDSEDEARERALAAPKSEQASTMTAVTVKPTAGVSRGQLVVNSSSSSRDRGGGGGGVGGGSSGPGVGIGVVQNIRTRPKTANGGGGRPRPRFSRTHPTPHRLKRASLVRYVHLSRHRCLNCIKARVHSPLS